MHGLMRGKRAKPSNLLYKKDYTKSEKNDFDDLLTYRELYDKDANKEA